MTLAPPEYFFDSEVLSPPPPLQAVPPGNDVDRTLQLSNAFFASPFLPEVGTFLAIGDIARLCRLSKGVRENCLACQPLWQTLVQRYKLGLQKNNLRCHDSNSKLATAKDAYNVVRSMVAGKRMHGAFIERWKNVDASKVWRPWESEVFQFWQRQAEKENEDTAKQSASCGPPGGSKEEQLAGRRLSNLDRKSPERLRPYSPFHHSKLWPGGHSWWGGGSVLRFVQPGTYYVMWRTNWANCHLSDQLFWYTNETHVQCTTTRDAAAFPLQSHHLTDRDSPYRVTLSRKERKLQSSTVSEVFRKYGWFDLRLEMVHVPTAEELLTRGVFGREVAAERDLRFSIWTDMHQRDHYAKGMVMFDIMYLWPVETEAPPLPTVSSRWELMACLSFASTCVFCLSAIFRRRRVPPF